MEEQSTNNGNTEGNDQNETQVDDPDRKEGFLDKRGKGASVFGRQSWKRRLFVVENNFLNYYKDKKEGTPLGAISLHNSDRVEEYEEIPRDPKHTFTFKLFTVKRTLLMCVESDQDRQAWIKAITKQIKKSPDYILSDRF